MSYCAPSHILPLNRAVVAPGRDANHEDAVLAAVRELWPCGDGTDQQELVDAEAAVFIDQILPRLEALEHLTVHEHGTRPDHTELRGTPARSEEHTSELQSRGHLVCRLLLEKKN